MNNRPMNLKQSYTEYRVETPTSVFAIGFEFTDGVNNIHVTFNGAPLEDAGYEAELTSVNTITITPAIPAGIVRIMRETDIDDNLYKFSSGARFDAAHMDANFEQIRHSQQELRDDVKYQLGQFNAINSYLELTGSTTFPEPDMSFGLYVTPRSFKLKTIYPQATYLESDATVTITIRRNDVIIGYIIGTTGSTTYILFADVTFNQGDILSYKIDAYHYTLNRVAVTVVGEFPIYNLV